MDNLTPEEKKMRDVILQAKAAITEANQIIRSCTHPKRRKVRYESCACAVCDKKLDGWWCDKSPDNVCHYFTTHDGKVRLENGQLVDPPEGYTDFDDESYDWCIYCGSPEERK
jgi:hypothetical protein